MAHDAIDRQTLHDAKVFARRLARKSGVSIQDADLDDLVSEATCRAVAKRPADVGAFLAGCLRLCLLEFCRSRKRAMTSMSSLGRIEI